MIGPDGVGKSSLVSLISGAREIQKGKVTLSGGDMSDRKYRNKICPKIAYMPQGLGKNLYPTLSVFENVDFFGRLFGLDREERKQRIDELLRATELSSFADRPAGKLSGGMKQKLGLCCSLIHLSLSIIGSFLLMLVIGYGISIDVENVDEDDSQLSKRIVDAFYPALLHKCPEGHSCKINQ